MSAVSVESAGRAAAPVPAVQAVRDLSAVLLPPPVPVVPAVPFVRAVPPEQASQVLPHRKAEQALCLPQRLHG